MTGRLLGQAPAVARGDVYDVAVVGAGVFGSWIAHELRQAGRRVVLIDAYGPGNARSACRTVPGPRCYGRYRRPSQAVVAGEIDRAQRPHQPLPPSVA